MRSKNHKKTAPITLTNVPLYSLLANRVGLIKEIASCDLAMSNGEQVDGNGRALGELRTGYWLIIQEIDNELTRRSLNIDHIKAFLFAWTFIAGEYQRGVEEREETPYIWHDYLRIEWDDLKFIIDEVKRVQG